MKNKRSKATVQRTKKGGTEGKTTKKDSIRGRKTKEGSGGGKKTKKGSGGGTRTKKKSTRDKMTGILIVVSILVVVGILVYLLASFWKSFCYNCLFLTLLLFYQLSIPFSGIFFFIFVIFIDSNSFFNFGTVIPVQIGRFWTEVFIRVKLGVKSTVF